MSGCSIAPLALRALPPGDPKYGRHQQIPIINNSATSEPIRRPPMYVRTSSCSHPYPANPASQLQHGVDEELKSPAPQTDESVMQPPCPEHGGRPEWSRPSSYLPSGEYDLAGRMALAVGWRMNGSQGARRHIRPVCGRRLVQRASAEEGEAVGEAV